MPVLDPAHLPPLALSVRQPWAWAILHGGKEIENRSLGAIRAGGMVPGRIALHAASGLRREEFAWGEWRLHRHGVRCPAPGDLPRGCIIGAVTVTEIRKDFDSEWCGGDWGLRLADPMALSEPIPAPGALGYFRWQAGGALASPARWMRDWVTSIPGLFDELPPEPKLTPQRPGRSRPVR